MIPPMTFQNFLVITDNPDPTCPTCSHETPSTLLCPECRHVFCIVNCVPTTLSRQPIQCPRCSIDSPVFPQRAESCDEALITDARDSSQQIRQRHEDRDDIVRCYTAWWWTRQMGQRMAKTTVPAQRVLEHFPFQGTIIIVVDHEGNRSQQVTLGGTAVRNGQNIDLLVKVKPHDPDAPLPAMVQHPARTRSRHEHHAHRPIRQSFPHRQPQQVPALRH